MPHSLIGSFFGFDDLAGVQAAERDLGRGHEVQVVILDAVDLRLRPAGNEADALEHVAAGQVGRDHRREALARRAARPRTAAAPAPAARLRSSGSRTRGRRCGAAFEVDQVVLLGQLRRGRAPGSRTAARRRSPRRTSLLASSPPTGASGCVRFGMLLWIAPASAPSRSMSACICVLRFAEPAALVLARFALGVVLRLADRLADLVRLPRKLFDLGLQLAPLRSRAATNRATSTFTPRRSQFSWTTRVFKNESLVEHDCNRSMIHHRDTESRGQGKVTKSHARINAILSLAMRPTFAL